MPAPRADLISAPTRPEPPIRGVQLVAAQRAELHRLRRGHRAHRASFVPRSRAVVSPITRAPSLSGATHRDGPTPGAARASNRARGVDVDVVAAAARDGRCPRRRSTATRRPTKRDQRVRAPGSAARRATRGGGLARTRRGTRGADRMEVRDRRRECVARASSARTSGGCVECITPPRGSTRRVLTGRRARSLRARRRARGARVWRLEECPRRRRRRSGRLRIEAFYLLFWLWRRSRRRRRSSARAVL